MFDSRQVWQQQDRAVECKCMVRLEWHRHKQMYRLQRILSQSISAPAETQSQPPTLKSEPCGAWRVEGFQQYIWTSLSMSDENGSMIVSWSSHMLPKFRMSKTKRKAQSEPATLLPIQATTARSSAVALKGEDIVFAWSLRSRSSALKAARAQIKESWLIMVKIVC